MLTSNKLLFFYRGILIAVFLGFLSLLVGFAEQDTAPAASADLARAVGTIQAMSGSAINLKKDDGSDAMISVQEATRFARVAPGQKDLKGATAIQLQDLQVGDRVLVRGKTSADNKSIVAAVVLVMKKADVEAEHQSDRQDWQQRGVGGVVSSVDTTAGTVTISTASLREKKTVTIRTTSTTIVRRYAPDSVKFDNAKIGTLSQIKSGDQLRARGTRSADGTELSADEIVSGSFRNIAGTITTANPNANTLSVMDRTTRKPVLVKITGESQVRKLPSEMAQRIAMRLKGTAGTSGSTGATAIAEGARPEGMHQKYGEHSGGSGFRTGGQPDFQQLLNRLTAVGVADFQKGEAVMIVSTEGAGAGEVTAITVLGGVEPILAASPNGAEPMRLSPWTLGSSTGGEEPAQ
jgi:Domain of unknown function (DUF5666)